MSLFIFLAFVALLVWACSGTSKRDKIGVTCVVQIAMHQGWVNPYRLNAQQGFSRKDGHNFLLLAQRFGLLYQGVNGRWYIVEALRWKSQILLTQGWSEFEVAKPPELITHNPSQQTLLSADYKQFNPLKGNQTGQNKRSRRQ